ncbi:MAG: hypothetical protein B6I20_05510 [Bacteroidetes bacterium 4572_117]|nr:MAG: hypothetical protein B6I20_05510 [Bacteroidetes bacterium 4572_117]
MTEIKAITITDKVVNIIKNISILVSGAFIGLMSALINLFTGFFTQTYTFEGWQVTLLLIAPFVLMGIAQFIHNRAITKRLFNKGDLVCIKGTGNKHIIKSYDFFRPADCICLSIKDKKLYKLDQVFFEPCKSSTPRTGHYKKSRAY